MKKKFLGCFILFVVIPFVASAGVFRAEVNNPRIPYGETFTLSLLYEGEDGNTLQPDLAPLQNDFTIYGTSTSFESKIINGTASQKRRWQMTLMPKKQGKITIPPIKAGKYTSNSLNIEIVSSEDIESSSPQKASPQAEMAKFKAKLEIADKDVFVHQSVPLTLKVYDNRDIHFNREPWFNENGEVVIKLSGTPKAEQKDGYRVVTFNYIAFPQKSGLITIPPAQIEGYYTVYERGKNSDDGFFHIFNMNMDMMFATQKPVAFQSDAAVLEVKPVPAEYGDDWWLPAKALKLSAKWSDSKPVFKVGETVAREITLTALGVTESQIPELNLPENKNWKQYPEKPQVSSVYDEHDNDLISQAVYRVVYIPQKSGRQQPPKILIKWFNIEKQQIEIAEIPSEIIEVEPESNSVQDEEIRNEVSQPEENINNRLKTNSQISGSGLLSQNIWLIISAVFVAFICGILLSFLIFSGKGGTTDKISPENLKKRIKYDLKKRDYRSLRDNLLLWGNVVFTGSEINNLKELSDVVADNDFSNQMQNLNENLYAGKSNHINEKVINNILKIKRKNTKARSEKGLLPELYK